MILPFLPFLPFWERNCRPPVLGLTMGGPACFYLSRLSMTIPDPLGDAGMILSDLYGFVSAL